MKDTEEALRRAHAAAGAGDPVGMLEAIAETPLIDGLARQLKRKWSRLPHDLVEDIVGRAVDALYAAVQKGRKVGNIAGYIVKAAHNMADDLQREFDSTEAFDFENADHVRPSVDELARFEDFDEDRVSEALEKARELLPTLGQENIRTVMSVILDALESGCSDISNDEIAEITDLSPATVAVLKHRGFKRLARAAAEMEGEDVANALIEWIENKESEK